MSFIIRCMELLKANSNKNAGFSDRKKESFTKSVIDYAVQHRFTS